MSEFYIYIVIWMFFGFLGLGFIGFAEHPLTPKMGRPNYPHYKDAWQLQLAETLLGLTAGPVYFLYVLIHIKSYHYRKSLATKETE